MQEKDKKILEECSKLYFCFPKKCKLTNIKKFACKHCKKIYCELNISNCKRVGCRNFKKRKKFIEDIADTMNSIKQKDYEDKDYAIIKNLAENYLNTLSSNTGIIISACAFVVSFFALAISCFKIYTNINMKNLVFIMLMLCGLFCLFLIIKYGLKFSNGPKAAKVYLACMLLEKEKSQEKE